MKFLIIAPRLHNNILPSLDSLRREGHEVVSLTLYQGKLEAVGQDTRVLGFSPLFNFLNKMFNKGAHQTTYLKNNFELKYGFPPLFKLFRTILKQKPDVMLIKNIASAFALIAALFGRICGARVVFMLQIDKYRPQIKSNSVELVGRIFNAFVITPILGDERYSNANENLHYIPFVIETPDTSRIYFQHDRINIMGLGKFTKRKNHEMLIKACAPLVQAGRKVHLTIIGERADETHVRSVVALIEDLQLTGHVTLKYDIPLTDVLSCFEQADLFVLPSSDEAAAFSPLEAMSRGAAVVSSSGNGTRCYVEQGVNGYVFKDRDQEELTRILDDLTSDRDRLQHFGQESLRLTREKHAPRIFAEKLLELLRF